MASEKSFKHYVPRCPRSQVGAHAEHAWAACNHCEHLSLRMLRSRLALLEEADQACVPCGSGLASAEAAQHLKSWGLQMELAEEVETAPALSLSYLQVSALAFGIWKPALRLLPSRARARCSSSPVLRKWKFSALRRGRLRIRNPPPLHMRTCLMLYLGKWPN